MALVNCFVSATHKVTSSSSTSTYAQWSSCVSKANTCFNNCTNPNPWAGKVLLWVDLINYFDIIQHGLLSYLLYCKSYILEEKWVNEQIKYYFRIHQGVIWHHFLILIPLLSEVLAILLKWRILEGKISLIFYDIELLYQYTGIIKKAQVKQNMGMPAYSIRIVWHRKILSLKNEQDL